MADQTSEVAILRAAQEAADGRERTLNAIIERLTSEKTTMEAQLQTLQKELQAAAEDYKHQQDRTTQFQTKCQVLQERLEDQATSLKLARDGHGDMQERLITAEAALAVKLETETGKLRQELLSVRERNNFLQTSVDEYRRQIEKQQDLIAVTRGEYEIKLKDERDGGHSRVHAMQERIIQAELDKTHALRETNELRDSLVIIKNEIEMSKKQAEKSRSLLVEQTDQIDGLTVQNRKLQEANARLVETGTSISTRYETNQLVWGLLSFSLALMYLGHRVSRRRRS
ncbi:hypothetical protein BC834DRAFT_613932 [Gloeopeniophorella convolvens]|nr:hypothetical protein BC834DRAFT_613932 [Gloeopeniophorella convolvens]